MVGEKGLSPEAADHIGEYVQLHGEHHGVLPLALFWAGCGRGRAHTRLAWATMAGAAALAQLRHGWSPQVGWT